MGPTFESCVIEVCLLELEPLHVCIFWGFRARQHIRSLAPKEPLHVTHLCLSSSSSSSTGSTAHYEPWPLSRHFSMLPYPELSFSIHEHQVFIDLPLCPLSSNPYPYSLPQVVFYGKGVVNPMFQPPIWGTRVSLFVWAFTQDLSGMGSPISRIHCSQHSSWSH